MKLTYSAGSPFARKLRIVAIELGLIERIELVPAATTPGQPNEAYMRDVNPVKKLPALILDDGGVLIDSFVIAEYLDELGGGGLVPASGMARWHARSDHSCLQGMLDSMLLCRYEKLVRPQALRWDAWEADHWSRAWAGMGRFEARDDVLAPPLDQRPPSMVQIALVCVTGYADFRFPDSGWRTSFPKLAAFHDALSERPSVKVSAPPPA